MSAAPAPPVIVTTFSPPGSVLAHLREAGEVRGPEEWRAHLAEADALLPLLTDRVDADLLEGAPRLRIVANAAAGYDNVEVEAARRRGIVVTNTPGVLTEATADLTWALLLGVVRGLPRAERSLRAGEFRGWGFHDYLGGDVTGATLGIYGMGRIGKAVARRAGPFGMRLRYHSRTRLPREEERALGVEWVEWETLLATSDVLSLHAPLTPATRHILDRRALSRMKPGSYLLNTARGPLVDEAALVEALRDGPLAGAGLDVYEREPEVTPGLLELPNVLLLPHIGSATPRTREAIAMLAARNVVAFLAGEGPLTPVE